MSEAANFLQTTPFSALAEKQAHRADDETVKGAMSKRELTPDPEHMALVQRLFLNGRVPMLRTVVFTAVAHNAGCSRVATGVAALLASSGHTVCLVEANFAAPSLARHFDLPSSPGLRDALETSKMPVTSVTHSVRHAAGLSVLLAGRAESGESILLDRARVRASLQALQAAFDLVIVDAAPADRDEAVAFGHAADGVVVVVEADHTLRTAATAAIKDLRALKISILGAVLNKRTFPIPEKLFRRL